MPDSKDSPNTGFPGEASLLRAVNQLRKELTETLNDGIAELRAAIDSIQAEHTRAMLDQEKRNGTFADRDRVERIANNHHDLANVVTGALGRITLCERRLDRMDTDQRGFETRVTTGGFKLLGGAAGYLVLVSIMLLSVLLTFLLSHHP